MTTINEDHDSSNYHQLYQLNQHKAPLSNYQNARIFMQYDSSVVGKFGVDTMKRQRMVLGPVSRPLEDNDIRGVWERIQSFGGLRSINVSTVIHAVHSVCDENPFNPLQDWIKSLKWDGKQRIDKLLPCYFGTPDTPYEQKIGEMFIAGLVARAMIPGCKNDYMLVLEGSQGIGKSTACRILGGEWFGESMPPLDNKETPRYVTTHWLIEWGEMLPNKARDIEIVKHFISKCEEEFRKPWQIEPEFRSRPCVFVGTINPSPHGYLKDDTGSRRFWPVRCGWIDNKALLRDRDQLFAEGYLYVQEGYTWYPDAEFEKQFIAPEQEERREVDPWLTPIVQYFEVQFPGIKETSVSIVCRDALGLDIAKIDRLTATRVATIMQSRGWDKTKDRRGLRIYKR